MLESAFWKQIKKNLPKQAFFCRVESKIPDGCPDVHMAVNGVSFWLELKIAKKTTKGNLKISPNQLAWNYAYNVRGKGSSYFLVKGGRQDNLFLFDGSDGSELISSGLLTKSLYEGKDYQELFNVIQEHCIKKLQFRVGSGRV